jgi:CheY-like chemotaxis protein
MSAFAVCQNDMTEASRFSGLAADVDWSRTALGEPAQWPHALRLTLDIVFNSPCPMLLCWGRERVVVYNDAYAAFAGPSHPAAPGARVPPMLPAPLTAAGAAFDQSLAGQAAHLAHQTLTFIAPGGPQTRHCDLYFTPIRDAQQQVQGVLCAMAPSQPAPAMPVPAAGLRILVVEDNLDSQYLVCEMLRAFGHENDGVAHAEGALEKLATGNYNVLFTDVSLPGMSGVELARRALRADPKLKVIFASGYGDALLRQVEFPHQSLQKPYEIEQLQKILANVSATV